jgi:hypothetical protein
MYEFFKEIEGRQHHEDRKETRPPFLKSVSGSILAIVMSSYSK